METDFERIVRRLRNNSELINNPHMTQRVKENLIDIANELEQKLNIASVVRPASDVSGDGELLPESDGQNVSDGFWCVEHDRFGNNKCKRQCELCETDCAKH